jgi:hypothetical protein
MPKGLPTRRKIIPEKTLEPEAVKPTPPPEVPDEPLTKQEAKDYTSKMTSTLKLIFRGADTLITLTNKNQAEAEIWTQIDDDDVKVIATHIIEMGMGNAKIARIVRKVSVQHRLFEIGVITFPSFIKSYKHYIKNGGFGLPLLGGQ